MPYFKPQGDPSCAALYFQKRRVHSALPGGSLWEFLREVTVARLRMKRTTQRIGYKSSKSMSSAVLLRPTQLKDNERAALRLDGDVVRAILYMRSGNRWLALIRSGYSGIGPEITTPSRIPSGSPPARPERSSQSLAKKSVAEERKIIEARLLDAQVRQPNSIFHLPPGVQNPLAKNQ